MATTQKYNPDGSPVAVGVQNSNPWSQIQGQTQQQQLSNPNLVDLRGKTAASGSGIGGTVGNSWQPPAPTPAKPVPGVGATSMFDGFNPAANPGVQQYTGGMVNVKAPYETYQPAPGFTSGGGMGDSFGRVPPPGGSYDSYGIYRPGQMPGTQPAGPPPSGQSFGAPSGAKPAYVPQAVGTRSEGYYDDKGIYHYGPVPGTQPSGYNPPPNQLFGNGGSTFETSGGYRPPTSGAVGHGGLLPSTSGQQPPTQPAGSQLPIGLGAFSPQITNTGTPGSYAPQIQPSIGGGTFATNQGTQIDPNNSLRTQQFLPGGTNTQYDQQALAALNGAGIPTEFSPLVNESRNMIAERLRGLGGPDRTQLAKEAFDIFQQQNEPIYQQQLRGVGQKAAALGRIGAGMTTNDLTGVLGQRNQQEDLLRRSLINDAAGQTLQDRLNTLQGTLSGSNTLEGQDFGRASTNAQLALQRGGLLGQMGQNEFNRGQANYQQSAQERAYQDYLARTAVEDRVRQQQLQQQQAQAEWQRQFSANQLAAQIAASQQTGYPSTQPAGNSYNTGVAAGSQAPVYQQPAYDPGPVISPSDPGSIFSNNPNPVSSGFPDLGYRDTGDRYSTDLFGDQRFGVY